MAKHLTLEAMAKRDSPQASDKERVSSVKNHVVHGRARLLSRDANARRKGPLPRLQLHRVPRCGLQAGREFHKQCLPARACLHHTKDLRPAAVAGRHAVALPQLRHPPLPTVGKRCNGEPTEARPCAVVVGAHGVGWRWRRSAVPRAAGCRPGVGRDALHEVGSRELGVVASSLQGTLGIGLWEAHGCQQLDVAYLMLRWRRQRQEGLVRPLPHLLKELTAVDLHARVLEVVALLSEVRTGKRSQVVCAPAGVPVLPRDGLANLALHVLLQCPDLLVPSLQTRNKARHLPARQLQALAGRPGQDQELVQELNEAQAVQLCGGLPGLRAAWRRHWHVPKGHGGPRPCSAIVPQGCAEAGASVAAGRSHANDDVAGLTKLQ
mmetsp:Transcript_8709/g.24536  ORF Transcript_8709/g.24536 Transcript_8709/m.24536 type:complete len:379 (-) Transcript_8709:478-1614(-)